MLAREISAKNGSACIRSFEGLNRMPKSSNGEFCDMENMTHDCYPSLCSVKSSLTMLTAPEGVEFVKLIIPHFSEYDPTKFSGIAKKDGKYCIYINDECVRDDIEEFTDAVDFGGAIITIPEFKGYNYVTKGLYAPQSSLIEPTKASTTKYTATFSSVGDGSKEEKITVNSFKTFFAPFEVGDCIAISDCTDYAADNNTWYPENSLDYSKKNPVLIKILEYNASGGYVRVAVYNAQGKMTEFPRHEVSNGGITVCKMTPKVSHICKHKNRLWATSKSGEYIYASALSEPLEFYRNDVLSTSSWFGGVGTSGKFTGLSSWNNRIIAFKKSSMSIVYGNDASDFSIEKTFTVGCTCPSSIAAVGQSLIWLGADGFYIYNGGRPQKISDKLFTCVSSCHAFASGGKYFAECDCSGKKEFFVYDTEKNLWSKLESENILGGDCDGADIYVFGKDFVKKLFSGEYKDFFAQTVPMYFDTFSSLSPINIYVRAVLDDGAFLNIYTKTDDGELQPHKGISKSGRSKLPIRYRSGDSVVLRFEGSGKVCITDLQMDFTTENY